MGGTACKEGSSGFRRLPHISRRFPSRCAPAVRQAASWFCFLWLSSFRVDGHAAWASVRECPLKPAESANTCRPEREQVGRRCSEETIGEGRRMLTEMPRSAKIIYAVFIVTVFAGLMIGFIGSGESFWVPLIL